MTEKAAKRGWTQPELDYLTKQIIANDYEIEDLPFTRMQSDLNRTFGSVKLRAERLLKTMEEKANPLVWPKSYSNAVFKYYLEGLPEGEILAKMQANGINEYALKDIVSEVKKRKAKLVEEVLEYSETNSIICKTPIILPTLVLYTKMIENLTTLNKTKLHKTLRTGR